MDYNGYKQYLLGIRQKYGTNVGLAWGKAHCAPKIDLAKELAGWVLVWAGVFSDRHFVRVRENWAAHGADGQREFFSYHYGPYEEGWDLLKVKPKKVIVRIDAMDYYGLGFHLHNGAKDKRIYQADLLAPDLSQTEMGAFISCVLSLRGGQSVEEAFGISFKQ